MLFLSGVVISHFLKKGAARTHIRTTPVIIMAIILYCYSSFSFNALASAKHPSSFGARFPLCV